MERAENINPNILAWARQTAGLSLEDAASKIGIQASAANSAAEKLEALESGQRFPTPDPSLPRLRASTAVRLSPSISNSLRPRLRGRGLPHPAFRRAAARERQAGRLAPDIRARAEMVKSILEDEDEAAPLDFVGSATVQQASRLSSTASPQSWKSGSTRSAAATVQPTTCSKDLRSRSERIGVFVLLVGDLGSHHHTISERVFRGFAIADRVRRSSSSTTRTPRPPAPSRSSTSWRISGWARPA